VTRSLQFADANAAAVVQAVNSMVRGHGRDCARTLMTVGAWVCVVDMEMLDESRWRSSHADKS
jgi:hypothetical protein